jgi:hypothetical protein
VVIDLRRRKSMGNVRHLRLPFIVIKLSVALRAVVLAILRPTGISHAETAPAPIGRVAFH